MASLVLADLESSEEMDQKALAELIGGKCGYRWNKKRFRHHCSHYWHHHHHGHGYGHHKKFVKGCWKHYKRQRHNFY
ncbi:MAG: hypothetical protein ABFS45_11140 [Pseudomonadota bacterium]